MSKEFVKFFHFASRLFLQIVLGRVDGGQHMLFYFALFVSHITIVIFSIHISLRASRGSCNKNSNIPIVCICSLRPQVKDFFCNYLIVSLTKEQSEICFGQTDPALAKTWLPLTCEVKLFIAFLFSSTVFQTVSFLFGARKYTSESQHGIKSGEK